MSESAPLRTAAELQLDLDVFSGPFDLLLTLVLREEIDLLEVDVAEVVLTYVDHLEQAGALDLEVTTEFLVLIAALLLLKSQLMLPREEQDLLEIGPQEALEELLARLQESHRYRGAASFLAQRLAEESPHRYRSAPPPAWLRRPDVSELRGVYDPALLGASLGSLLKVPPQVRIDHLRQARVTVAERLARLRSLLGRGRFDFDEAVRGADRVTVAVTLFALLELYKRGEASWEQGEPFGEITVVAGGAPAVTPATAPQGAMEVGS